MRSAVQSLLILMTSTCQHSTVRPVSLPVAVTHSCPLPARWMPAELFPLAAALSGGRLVPEILIALTINIGAPCGHLSTRRCSAGRARLVPVYSPVD